MQYVHPEFKSKKREKTLKLFSVWMRTTLIWLTKESMQFFKHMYAHLKIYNFLNLDKL